MSQRILVFENDAAFAQGVKSSFERLGASVQVASDGPSGLELAAGSRPDLILLTIELPGMNGFLVCKKIKKTVELENVPLIILSSEVDEETFEQHKKLRTRADDYIRKPIAFADLIERVKPLVPLNGNGAAALVDAQGEHDDAIALAEEDDLIVLGDEVESAEIDAGADTAVNEAPAMESVRPPSEPAPAPQPVLASPPAAAFAPPAAAFTPAERPAPAAAFAPPAPSGASVAAVGGTSASTVELDRLRRELQAADERLQTAEKRAAAAEQRATGAEKSLDAAKRTGGVSSRELLDMREQLNRKERELLDLRDQVTARDKQLIEASERGLGVERDLQDAREKALEVQRELDKKLEVVNALTADKEASKKRLDDAKSRTDRAEAKQKELGVELDEIKGRHQGELDKLRTEQGEQEAARKAEHSAALAKANEDHARALDTLKQEQARALENLKQEHARVLDRLDQDQAKTVSSLKQEHSQLLERTKQDSTAALDSLRRNHQEELSELREEHVVSQKLATGTAEQEKRAALDSLRSELVSTHEAQTRELVSAHEAERERATKKQTTELTEQADKHRQDMARLGRALSEAEARYALLEEKHEDTDSQRQTAERDLKAMIGERDQQIARGRELSAELERLKGKLQRDDETLARVQKALAIGIGLLEERKAGN